MGNTHAATAIVTAVLVAGGVWVGATVFDSSAPPLAPGTTDTADANRVPAPPPAPPPLLRSGTGEDGTDAARLAPRVAALEKEVRVLRAALTQATDASKPLLDLYEKFKTGSPLPVMPGVDEVEPGSPEDTFGEPMGGRGLARYLAKKAGADPKRALAMSQEFEQIDKELQRLEKENARVERDGETTTITIGRYAADGDRIKRRWTDWLAGGLTHQERDKFEKDGGTNKLLGSRLGALARTITIKEAGGSIDVTERGESSDGAVTEYRMQGPAIARDSVLEGYLHLLR